jgi:phage regulator Rha-like protein
MVNDKLTIIRNNKIFVSTDSIAQELERDHNSILKNVKSYKKELELLGAIRFEFRLPLKGKGGKITSFVNLNEEQFIFLIMNMRTKSNEMTKILQLKLKISKEFVDQKKLILMKNNAEYIEVRNNNKFERRQLTDTIKEFIAYAYSNGSKSAYRYYTLFSNMENSALLIKNKRDMLTIDQLTDLKSADKIIINTILEGMEAGMFYKDIFKLAKIEVNNFCKKIGIKKHLSIVEAKPKPIEPEAATLRIAVMES